MRVFIRVVDLASFGHAAKQLGMSAAAVTRSISMLEAHLNVRLLNRSTRSVTVTDEGHAYLAACTAIVDQLDEMESNLVRSSRELSGTLRLAASTPFAHSGLVQLLAIYRGINPRITFDVTTCDAPIDMIEGGFHVGFMTDRTMPNSRLVSRQLMAFTEIAVASPAYLAKHGAPANPSALNNHSLLSASDGAARMWEFSDRHDTYRIPVGKALHASSSATIRAAALADMGIALLPVPLVESDLVEGRLLPILGQFTVSNGPRSVSIVYTGRNFLSAKVRHFIDFVVGQYRMSEEPASLRAVA